MVRHARAETFCQTKAREGNKQRDRKAENQVQVKKIASHWLQGQNMKSDNGNNSQDFEKICGVHVVDQGVALFKPRVIG